jgi:hypothetical protein
MIFTRATQAKVDTARREQQIVALRLRGVSFFEIARLIGIMRTSAHRAFAKALRRQTEDALDAYHQEELAGLALEAANVWRSMDANKDNWQAQMSGTAQLRGIHIRRAKLLGLDAPTKLDVSGIYKRGGEQFSAERLERQRVLEALPLAEQERIYELFEEARKRAAGTYVETTAVTVTNGLEHRGNVPESEPEE